MKKILLVIIYLLCLCGCNSKSKKLSTTICTYKTENYTNTWTIKYNNNNIYELSTTGVHEYETLEDAKFGEKRANENCKNVNYYCNVSRNNKTVTEQITYECGKNTPDDIKCNYSEWLKDSEKYGLECK